MSSLAAAGAAASKVPFETLISIFQHVRSKKDVHNCQLVCKGWRRAAQSILYTTFDVEASWLEEDVDDMNDMGVDMFAKEERKLRSFVNTVQHLAPHVGRFVKTISLRNCLLSIPDGITLLGTLLDACRNLEELYCTGDSVDVAWPYLLMLPDNHIPNNIKAIVHNNQKTASSLYPFVALKLKRSLVELQWTIDDTRPDRMRTINTSYAHLVQQLPQFVSLKSLYFPICRFFNYNSLCQVIDPCVATVTELTFDLLMPVFAEEQGSIAGPVQPNHSIETICIKRAVLRPHLTTYLASKFKGLKKLSADFSKEYAIGHRELAHLCASLDSFEICLDLTSTLSQPEEVIPILGASPNRCLVLHFKRSRGGIGFSIDQLVDLFENEDDDDSDDDDDDDDSLVDHIEALDGDHGMNNLGLPDLRDRMRNRVHAEFRAPFMDLDTTGLGLVKEGNFSRIEMRALEPESASRIGMYARWIGQYAPTDIFIENMGHLKKSTTPCPLDADDPRASDYKQWLQMHRSDLDYEERNQVLLATVINSTVDTPNTTIRLSSMVILGAISEDEASMSTQGIPSDMMLKHMTRLELYFANKSQVQNLNIKNLILENSLFTPYLLAYVSTQLPVLDMLLLDACCILGYQDHTYKVIMPHTRVQRLGITVAATSIIPLHNAETAIEKHYLENVEFLDALSPEKAYTLKVETKEKTYICKKQGDKTLPVEEKDISVGTKDNFLVWIICQDLQELSIVNGDNPVDVYRFQPLESCFALN